MDLARRAEIPSYEMRVARDGHAYKEFVLWPFVFWPLCGPCLVFFLEKCPRSFLGAVIPLPFLENLFFSDVLFLCRLLHLVVWCFSVGFSRVSCGAFWLAILLHKIGFALTYTYGTADVKLGF